MRSTSALAVLFGKTRRAVLGLLFSQPDQRFYLRELTRRLALSPGAVQRELRSLQSCNLIVRDRHRFYTANMESPCFAPLRELLLLGMATHESIRRVLDQYSAKIRCAFIFGSFARNQVRDESDIDLLVISDGSLTMEAFVRDMSVAQKAIEREINPFILSSEEFSQRVGAHNPFLLRVLAGEKLFLIGDQHELEQLAEKRLAPAASDQPAGNQRPARHRSARSQGQQNPRPE